MQESLYFHALNAVPGVGAMTLRQLVGQFGTAEKAWAASPEAWRKLPDIGPKTLEGFATSKNTFDFSAAEATLAREEIEIIPFLDSRFPSLLSETPHPPALLYVRGNTDIWKEKPLIAIVGSRKTTAYGTQVTEELARALSQAGFTIVSGLAFGIDGIAHEATLDTDGLTLAVLGTGNDTRTITPQSHLALAERILEKNGAIITEYPPDMSGNAGTFPARNRIIAGISLGTIVIEAAEESGALITARYALDYNREVFAVPGSIFSPASAGTNALLKQGAKVVTGINDILEELAPHIEPVAKSTRREELVATLSDEEKKFLATLSSEPLHVDKIIEISRLETTRVNMLLTKLEMRGVVKNIGNMHYIKTAGS